MLQAFLLLLAAQDGSQYGFSDFLKFPDYVQGAWGNALSQKAVARQQQVRAFLQSHPGFLGAQYVRVRRVPGYAASFSTVVYGVIQASPSTVAAAVTDYEVFGPYIPLTTSARLIKRQGISYTAPSRQATVRYLGFLYSYVLRQGLKSYSVPQGTAYQADWENIAVQSGMPLTMDLHGFARYEPFTGPQGQDWTLYRYDSFAAVGARPLAQLAAAQFSVFPPSSSYWSEIGGGWMLNSVDPVSRAARSFRNYVEALVQAQNGPTAQKVRAEVAERVLPTYGDSLADYISARKSALAGSLQSPLGSNTQNSIIWDYAPLAVNE